MKTLQVGDKVVVVGVPTLIQLIYPLRGGEIGEVIKTCTCLETAIEKTDISAKTKEYLREIQPYRVNFGGQLGKICVPRKNLRKIEDDDSDKMVDWSKVPKPWEIGVKS